LGGVKVLGSLPSYVYSQKMKTTSQWAHIGFGSRKCEFELGHDCFKPSFGFAPLGFAAAKHDDVIVTFRLPQRQIQQAINF
jgi:hypothetical protein